MRCALGIPSLPAKQREESRGDMGGGCGGARFVGCRWDGASVSLRTLTVHDIGSCLHHCTPPRITFYGWTQPLAASRQKLSTA